MQEHEQGLLFPELNPYLTKVKDIDYVDISTIKGSEFRSTDYSILPKGKYILFKSGGYNKYMEELGNCFPYIHNTKTGKILTVTTTDYEAYPKTSITIVEGFDKPKGLMIFYHRVVAEAFIENDNPDLKKLVDHKDGNQLDYRVNNLRWVTASQNATGTKRPRQLSFLEKARIDKIKKNEKN